MSERPTSDSDLEGLRRHIKDGASMPYLDTDKQQRLEGVLRRWPLLQGLRTREHRDSD